MSIVFLFVGFFDLFSAINYYANPVEGDPDVEADVCIVQPGCQYIHRIFGLMSGTASDIINCTKGVFRLHPVETLQPKTVTLNGTGSELWIFFIKDDVIFDFTSLEQEIIIEEVVIKYGDTEDDNSLGGVFARFSVNGKLTLDNVTLFYINQNVSSFISFNSNSGIINSKGKITLTNFIIKESVFNKPIIEIASVTDDITVIIQRSLFSSLNYYYGTSTGLVFASGVGDIKKIITVENTIFGKINTSSSIFHCVGPNDNNEYTFNRCSFLTVYVKSSSYGGIFRIEGRVKAFTISECIFKNIYAPGSYIYGGAIYVNVNSNDDLKILIKNTTFSGFNGGSGTGFIYLGGTSRSVNLSYVYFERNLNGPDIYVESSECFYDIGTINTYTTSHSLALSLVKCDGGSSDESYLLRPLKDNFTIDDYEKVEKIAGDNQGTPFNCELLGPTPIPYESNYNIFTCSIHCVRNNIDNIADKGYCFFEDVKNFVNIKKDSDGSSYFETYDVKTCLDRTPLNGTCNNTDWGISGCYYHNGKCYESEFTCSSRTYPLCHNPNIDEKPFCYGYRSSLTGGICVEKQPLFTILNESTWEYDIIPCDERVYDGSTKDCRRYDDENCYYFRKGSEEKCVSFCPLNTDAQIIQRSSGVYVKACFAKQCEGRSAVNYSCQYEAGEKCYYDSNSTPKRCVKTCTSVNDEPVNGFCKLKACANRRISHLLSSDVCGVDPNCFGNETTCYSIDAVRVGGKEESVADDSTCGSDGALACLSLDRAVKEFSDRWDSIKTPYSPPFYKQILVNGDTSINTKVNITGVRINRTKYDDPSPQIIVGSAGCLVYHIKEYPSDYMLASNIAGIISDVTFVLSENRDVPFISGSAHHDVYSSSTEFTNQYFLLIIHNVLFKYTNTLTAPIISLIQFERYSFNLTQIIKETPAEPEPEPEIEPTSDVCLANTVTPALSFVDSVGWIYRSNFSNINTGAIKVNGGILYIARVQFVNNTIKSVPGFKIRHNLYYTMGAIIKPSHIKTDTGDNWFFATDEEPSPSVSVINPVVYSVSSSRGSSSSTFTFRGDNFAPCGLKVKVISKGVVKKEWDAYYELIEVQARVCINLNSGEIPTICKVDVPLEYDEDGVNVFGSFKATVVDSTTLTVSIPDTALVKPYGYIGNDRVQVILSDNFEKNHFGISYETGVLFKEYDEVYDPISESSSKAWIAPTVLAILFFVILVVVIIIIIVLVVRANKRKEERRLKRSASSERSQNQQRSAPPPPPQSGRQYNSVHSSGKDQNNEGDGRNVEMYGGGYGYSKEERDIDNIAKHDDDDELV